MPLVSTVSLKASRDVHQQPPRSCAVDGNVFGFDGDRTLVLF